MGTARVTVFGGSGFIGRHLVAQMVTDGAKVRIAVRHSYRLSHHQPETVAADVLDDASVRSAVGGSSSVINLVGILSEAGRHTYAAIHIEGARRVAVAARDAGVLRLIHVSALGVSRTAPALSDRTKAAGEEAVRATMSRRRSRKIRRIAAGVGASPLPVAL